MQYPLRFFRNFARLVVFSLFCVRCCSAVAACPPRPFTDPSQVRIKGDSVLIVVHASSKYDARLASKRGIDEAVQFAKGKGIPVVFLEDESPEKFHFTDDCNPDYWVFSEGGEVTFEVPARHLYIAGGHLELCLSVALHSILNQWARQPSRDATVTYLMDAIYSNGEDVEATDPFYGDFWRFMGVVTYGRPAGEYWPKLTLLETMGAIGRENQQMGYLQRVLPRWDRTFSDQYQVELELAGWGARVLRPAPGWRPPRLLFEFVDSAMDLTLENCMPTLRGSRCAMD